MKFSLFWAQTALLAEALPWHSIHSLALLNCHNSPRGGLLHQETARLKKEYSISRHYWPLCLTFAGRLLIHYSWLLCVEPGFLLLFKSHLNIHELWFWTTPKLWPLSLRTLQSSPCVFSDYARYLFSHMRPTDQMAIGLSCPSYSNPLP